MKNMKKIASVLLTLAMLATMASSVLASYPVPITTGTAPWEGGVSKILGAIQWIGYAFALGMLIYIGIKYTMSAANEKADLKKGLINFVIGAALIAGAATICGWIKGFVDENVSE